MGTKHKLKKLPRSTRNCRPLVEASTLDEVEKILGSKFKRRALLAQALMHKSCQHTVNGIVVIQSNEKLEHLGDSVLKLAVCDYLHKKYSEKNEHFYSQVLPAAVTNLVLNDVGKSSGLERFLIKESANTLLAATSIADMVEAVIAALFRDRGLKAVHRFLSRYLYPTVDVIVASR